MTDRVISVENVSKQYRLGEVGTGSLRHDLNRWWHLVRGKEDPYLRVGESNDRTVKGNSEYVWALKDLSFEVRRGEVLGIIGRNGAGKSTLLKILSRVTMPTLGQIKTKGRIASLLEVGTGFHPELTGRENIFLNGAILGMRKSEISRKLDEIIDFSNCDRFIDTPVKRYSSGMYVRLAFAVAAHLEPDILIVDEVLAVGDAEFQKKCMGKLGQVAENGRTVIFVSHTMSAVARLCSRAILFKNGTVFTDSDVQSVIAGYLGDARDQTTGVFDLTDHPSRALSSRLVITQIRVTRANGEASTRFFPNDECVIEIQFRSSKRIRAARWAVAIEDYLGRRLVTFASYFDADNAWDIEAGSSGTVRCSMGTLSLGTGRYLLSVSVADRIEGMVDSVDNAAWIEVLWNNNYSSGEPYNSVYGPVLRQSNWTLNKDT